MAKQKQIAFTGIQRAIPQSNMPDGACQEIINLRPRKGCWRPIGTKKVYKSINLSAYSKAFEHDIEGGLINGEPNLIGLKNLETHSEVYLIDTTTGMATQIGGNLDSSITVNVVFLKRTMLITTGTGVKIFIWTDGSYAPLADLPIPDVDLSKSSSKLVESEHFHLAEAVLGGYYKALNTASEDEGHQFGSIMYITVYRLFDGSYLIPNIPRYLEINNGGIVEQNNPNGGSQSDSTWWFEFYVSKLQATINNELYTDADFGKTKDLIESICIFATRATPLHKIDETTLTDTILASYGTGENNRQFKVLFPVSDDFKKLAQSAGWYKIHEFIFEDVIGKTGKKTESIDTIGFYQDYATRETLPTDQFTHHENVARVAYTYNDRLHLLNIKTSLGLPYVIWPDNTETWGSGSTIDGIIAVWVKTSLGQAIVKSNIQVPVYRESATSYIECGENYDLALESVVTAMETLNYISGSAYIEEIASPGGTSYIVWYKIYASSDEYFVLPSVVGYNDSRAYKMQITVNSGSGNLLLFSESLTKNTLMNFSTWNSKTFNVDQANATSNFALTKKLTSSVTEIATIPATITLPFDTNRLQVSEIQNPLIYPAKNSYQIGTGDGLAMAAGSEPLSSGQFGQFPLQVFTTKGIWALEIGTGDVLYTNILPVNSEVINNPNNVLSIGSGVVYTTDTGLFLINGREVIELSEVIENNFDRLLLLDTVEIDKLLSDVKYTPGLANALSDIDFLTYLQTSVIGYDHLNKELLITNVTYGYSYVYSFESQAFFKIYGSYKMLINSYPKLHAVTNSNILSISEELNTDAIECLIISSAQSLEGPETFKKIERAILRSKLSTDTGSYSGFYLFASDDLNTWQFITGKQKTGSDLKDLMIQRSHGTSKYYAFVFAGKLFTDSEIKQIDLIFNIKWNNRLR